MILHQCTKNCDHKMNSVTACSVKVWVGRMEGQKKWERWVPHLKLNVDFELLFKMKSIPGLAGVFLCCLKTF